MADLILYEQRGGIGLITFKRRETVAVSAKASHKNGTAPHPQYRSHQRICLWSRIRNCDVRNTEGCIRKGKNGAVGGELRNHPWCWRHPQTGEIDRNGQSGRADIDRENDRCDGGLSNGAGEPGCPPRLTSSGM